MEEVIWIAYFPPLLFLLLTLFLRLLLFFALSLLYFPLRLVLLISFLRLHGLDSRAAYRGRICLLIFRISLTFDSQDRLGASRFQSSTN